MPAPTMLHQVRIPSPFHRPAVHPLLLVPLTYTSTMPARETLSLPILGPRPQYCRTNLPSRSCVVLKHSLFYLLADLLALAARPFFQNIVAYFRREICAFFRCTDRDEPTTQQADPSPQVRARTSTSNSVRSCAHKYICFRHYEILLSDQS